MKYGSAEAAAQPLGGGAALPYGRNRREERHAAQAGNGQFMHLAGPRKVEDPVVVGDLQQEHDDGPANQDAGKEITQEDEMMDGHDRH